MWVGGNGKGSVCVTSMGGTGKTGDSDLDGCCLQHPFSSGPQAGRDQPHIQMEHNCPDVAVMVQVFAAEVIAMWVDGTGKGGEGCV